MLPSQWAEEYRILPKDGASAPGPWRNEKTPYLVEVMNTLAVFSKAREVVFVKGTQIGGTEAALNWIYYLIDQVGGPILALQPTEDNASEWSKQRVGPGIDLCKKIKEKSRPARSRDSDSTILEKGFTGGCRLFLSGVNTPNALASKPIGNLVGDEIDRWPLDVGGNGDPVLQVKKRLSTYKRGKMFFLSTPVLLKTSRIWKLYQESDQRIYEVPCPHCGHMQEITFDKLVWNRDTPDAVYMACEHCAGAIQEYHKTEMLAGGKWRTKNPGHWRIGFHLSTLYSPLGWYSWADAIREFLEAEGDVAKMQAFVNTVLGLPWEEDMESIAAEYLSRRVEKYKAQVPDGVLAVTVAVDVQKDRIECEVAGWGEGEESWGIQYRVFRGDPGVLASGDPMNPSVWEQLTDFRRSRFRCADGYEFVACCTTIDSGGNHTDTVYAYAKGFHRENVYAVKGGSQPTRPFMNRPTRAGKVRVWLFVLGVNKGKDIVFERLKIDAPGPGYCHFPDDENTGYNAHYYSGLINEKRKSIKKNGVEVTVWELPKGAHNEQFDIRVYGLAAIRIRNPQWERLKERRRSMTPASFPVTQAPTPMPAAEAEVARRSSGPGVIDNSPVEQRVRQGIQLIKV